jgi:hypothetical protein
MIQFIKPTKINGEQLLEELNAAGVTITEPPMIDGDGNLWLEIKATDKTKATAVVEAHVGIDQVKTLTIEEKLASVGLSLNDLKTALGL